MFHPVPPPRLIDGHLIVSRMADALRPYRCADIEGFARLALRQAGFAPADVAAYWRAAATAVLARRRAFPQAEGA